LENNANDVFPQPLTS